jgi:hypothetical protein
VGWSFEPASEQARGPPGRPVPLHLGDWVGVWVEVLD